jgi:hypothetical protein
VVADAYARNPFRGLLSLDEEQDRHTFKIEPQQSVVVGMAQPVDPRNDTSTVQIVSPMSYKTAYEPIRIDFGYCYSNTSNYSNLFRSSRDEDDDEKRWRKYWQEFLVSKVTPYTKLTSKTGWKQIHGVKNVPCAPLARKQAFSPARRSHARFMAQARKPTGFAHTRRFP